MSTILDLTQGLAQVVLDAILAQGIEVDPDLHPWHNRQPADLEGADDLEGCPPRVEFYIAQLGGYDKGTLRRMAQCGDLGIDLRIRYRTCWPVPEDPAAPSPDELAAGEAEALVLERVGWAGTVALAAQLCTPTVPAASLGTVHVGIVTPLQNLGGSTGWEWPLTVRPRLTAIPLTVPPPP